MYTPVGVTWRGTLLMVFAVFVAVFMALYPAMDCDPGECPEAMPSHLGFSTACLVAVLVASGSGALAFAAFRGRCRIADQQRPVETFLSPDPPPPRMSSSR